MNAAGLHFDEQYYRLFKEEEWWKRFYCAGATNLLHKHHHLVDVSGDNKQKEELFNKGEDLISSRLPRNDSTFWGVKVERNGRLPFQNRRRTNCRTLQW